MVRKIDIRLHEDYYNVLHMFGDLDTVVRRILDEGARGNIELTDKPQAPPKQGTHKYIVTIDSPYYDELVGIYGVSSSKVSIRRLLYWFVDEEVYNELGWNASKPLHRSRWLVRNGYIADALTALRKLHDITLSRTQKATILTMAQQLIEIKEDGDERERTT